ncbi:MAG: class E sortase [Solirubrobacterales bacterium]|nr:class E sortase [Solirubrobacterales bacterium]
MRRAIQVVSTALITAGLVILLDAGLTVAWGEPVSTLDGWLAQRGAREELTQLEQRYSQRPVTKADGRTDLKKVALRAGELEAEAKDGDAIGRLRIPAVDLDIVLIQGTDEESLQKGPGHYPGTVFPGQHGTIGIAGHRTTYLAPFRHIDRLADGDTVVLEMPYATFTYEFESQKIVEPTALEVVRDVGEDRVVLTACNPVYSAAQRIVVTSRLVDVATAGEEDTQPVRAGPAPASKPIEAPAEIASPGLGPTITFALGAVIIALGMWFMPRGRRYDAGADSHPPE